MLFVVVVVVVVVVHAVVVVIGILMTGSFVSGKKKGFGGAYLKVHGEGSGFIV